MPFENFGKEERGESKDKKKYGVFSHAGCFLINIIGHVEFHPKGKIPQYVAGPANNCPFFQFAPPPEDGADPVHACGIERFKCNTFQDAENPSLPIFLSSGRKAPSKLGDIHGDSIFTEVVLPNGEKQGMNYRPNADQFQRQAYHLSRSD